MRQSRLLLVLAAGLLGTACTTATIDGDPTTAPLPESFLVFQVEASVSAERANFLGAWRGTWASGFGQMIPHVLVVEQLRANGEAVVVAANAAAPDYRRKGWWRRRTAKFDGDDLIVHLDGGMTFRYTYTPQGRLIATYTRGSGGTTSILERFEVGRATGQSGATSSDSPPLPFEMKVTAPASDLRRDVAGFSGKWVGLWESTLQSILVVERIEGDKATAIYSWGVSPSWGINRAGFVRFNGTIENGVLHGRLPNGAEVAFRIGPELGSLAGQYVRQGNVVSGFFRREP